MKDEIRHKIDIILKQLNDLSENYATEPNE